MKRTILAAAAFAAAALATTAATAAPFSGAGRLGTGFDAGIVQVHGVHRECAEGRMGWHRSTPWGGRIACAPRWNKWRYNRHEGRGHGRGHDDHDRGPSRNRDRRGSH